MAILQGFKREEVPEDDEKVIIKLLKREGVDNPPPILINAVYRFNLVLRQLDAVKAKLEKEIDDGVIRVTWEKEGKPLEEKLKQIAEEIGKIKSGIGRMQVQELKEKLDLHSITRSPMLYGKRRSYNRRSKKRRRKRRKRRSRKRGLKI